MVILICDGGGSGGDHDGNDDDDDDDRGLYRWMLWFHSNRRNSISSSDSEETGMVRISHVAVLTHKITRRVLYLSMGEREPKRS